MTEQQQREAAQLKRRAKNCTQCNGRGTIRIVLKPQEGQLRRVAVKRDVPLGLPRAERRRQQRAHACVVALRVGSAPPVLTVDQGRILAPADWQVAPAQILVAACGCQRAAR